MRLHRGAASEEPRSASKCGKLSLISIFVIAVILAVISSKDINKYSQIASKFLIPISPDRRRANGFSHGVHIRARVIKPSKEVATLSNLQVYAAGYTGIKQDLHDL